MNTKVPLLSALLLFLAVLTLSGTSTAFASPEETTPPPSPTPQPTSTPEDDDGGVMTQIFKVMFDASTLKEAIVNVLDSLFEDALGGLTDPSSPFYQLGGQISRFVFGTPELKEIRLDAWIQMRKVAFALLPLTAVLTIWVSMKEGLYSVTGYANTFEAVTEFVVSIALALASYWLMEQAISLTQIMTLAIADTLDVDITATVFTGLMLKPLVPALTRPILSMIFNILAFALVLAFMGSVLLAFLARELVLVMTVALAPVMILLGAVRPLGWLRGLWTKAFFVFLLLLPVNVLTLGIAVRLHISALDLATGPLATFIHILIIAGTLSVLIAVNGTLGKLVYGAAIQVTKKVGKTMTSMATMAAGLAVGVGALGGSGLGAVGGAGTLGGGGGSGAGGSALAASQTGGSFTGTSKLTSSIGRVLSTSGNAMVSGFGKGMRIGDAYKDEQLRLNPPSSTKLNVAENGIPGRKEGVADLMEQIDSDPKAAAIGSDRETLAARVTQGVQTSEATLQAVEEDGLSAKDFLQEAHYLHPGRTSVKRAGREYIRAEAGSYAFADKSRYQQTDIVNRVPSTRRLHARDYQAAQRIVQQRQRTGDRPLQEISAAKIQSLARAVHARRLSGTDSYKSIIHQAAEDPNLQEWMDLSKGLIT